MKTNTILVCLVILGVLGGFLGVDLVWMSLYNEKSFCCRHMSYTLGPFLHFLGFDVKILWGYNTSHNTGHCWISVNGVYIDSTTLLPNCESGYMVYFTDCFPYRYCQTTPYR